MSSDHNEPSTSSLSSPSSQDWTDSVTDLIVSYVDQARDKTTGPILNAARWVVYGLVAAIIAVMVLFVVFIAIGRAASLIPGPDYYAHGVLGFVMIVGGFIVWQKRSA